MEADNKYLAKNIKESINQLYEIVKEIPSWLYTIRDSCAKKYSSRYTGKEDPDREIN